MKSGVHFLYFSTLLILSLVSCSENTQYTRDCAKYIHEQYLEEKIDPQIEKEVREYQDYLLKKFDDTSIEGVGHEAYHLLFYSSHGFGKTIKFEKIKGDIYYLSINCIAKKEWYPDCEDYHIALKEEEWQDFEKMIYEFNFWTAEKFKSNRNVLDGHAFLLEGVRPDAKECAKRTYQIIGRGSPRYDKMGALCDYILDYEDQLASRYGKREL